MSKGYKEYLNRNKRYNILIVSIQILIINGGNRYGYDNDTENTC